MDIHIFSIFYICINISIALAIKMIVHTLTYIDRLANINIFIVIPIIICNWMTIYSYYITPRSILIFETIACSIFSSTT